MRWDESTWDHELLDAMTGAIAVRRANPALRHGSFGLVGAEGTWCAWRRDHDAATLVVAVNAGDAASEVELPLPDLARRRLLVEPWRAEGAVTTARTIGDDGRLRLTVPAHDGIVLRVVP